jgi:signal transduction histidine kinase
MDVSLSFLVEEALKAAEEDIARSSLRVENRITREDCNLRVDVEQMIKCFYQIIQNACKFAGQGKTLQMEARVNRDVTVRFLDNGPGIPKRKICRVFDVFYQVDFDDTGEVPGVGIGLWWSRKIAKAHGGDVSIESPLRNGEPGASVEIHIPLTRLVDGESEPSVVCVSERPDTLARRASRIEGSAESPPPPRPAPS